MVFLGLRSKSLRETESRCAHPIPAMQRKAARVILNGLRAGLGGEASEEVGALILRVTGVPGEPVKADLVHPHQLVEFPPQVLVRHRQEPLPFAAPPVLLLPAGEPLRDPALEVGGVGEQVYLDGLTQGAQRLDRRLKLHPVVCRLPLAAGDLLAVGTGKEDRPPPARARVPDARAVGVDPHLLHRGRYSRLPLACRGGPTRSPQVLWPGA